MRWLRFVTASGSAVLVAVLTVQTLGCGAMSSTPNRVLQSMTLNPANADAQNFSSGQVPFTAVGTFSLAPSPAPVPFVAPYSGTWSVSDSSVATIDQSGVAKCVSGAAGTVTIMATASSNSAHGTQMSTAVSSSTKLTCP
jgi:hypothetical protein